MRAGRKFSISRKPKVLALTTLFVWDTKLIADQEEDTVETDKRSQEIMVQYLSY